MLISDYAYDLPDELIAQQPLEDRTASRMLVVDRSAGTFADDKFARLPSLLRCGDVLVVNNTRVFPARLFGETETGARVEIFLTRARSHEVWEALARPARRLGVGKRINFDGRLAAEVVEKLPDGPVVVRFSADGDIDRMIDEIGVTPLPPYIKRSAAWADGDRERYQTVYAASRGAIAAPTAGLHFTPEIIEQIKQRGVQVAEVTLHVGYGTFEPVRVSDLSQHRVQPERFSIDDRTAHFLNEARAENRRIIAVGTTSVRTLETVMQKHGRFAADDGWADLTITPGFRFSAISGLLTNFHLPESSLLVLVSTFGGRELIMKAYEHAVDKEYRFYSYGDCMLIT